MINMVFIIAGAVPTYLAFIELNPTIFFCFQVIAFIYVSWLVLSLFVKTLIVTPR